jgi:flavin reductase (DIM6/NTAB) family NADH-FMN oxidoreductase RutF
LRQELAMKPRAKQDFPVSNVRRFLEPGPIVLVSSAWKGERTIMTMGWHMIMEFVPSRIGCYIWDQNHSHKLVRASKECVINIPTVDMAAKVVGIGNSTGRDIDKFEKFKLTAEKGAKVKAPLIGECFANFECRLVDTSLIRKYSLFVFEVVKAHVAPSPKFPRTLHYRGDGIFMLSGQNTARYRRLFRPEML